MQQIVPMLAYEDGPAALDWLANAFGFREVTRWLADDGSLSHGELELDDGQLIMLATPTPEYRSPKRHREECEQARAWSEVPYVIDGVLVYVADFDAHLDQARAAGATILSEPDREPGGLRRYRAEDLEGHRWMFVERERRGSAVREPTRQTRFSNVSNVSSTSSGPLRSCTVPCTRRGGSAVRT